ncbi:MULTISPECIES: M56 family metallopeptidase [unclassified Listeria]|uniref:M56 family metallopeptidase n=2 Tax=Listeria TaxID=1637 RepID=UPI000B5977DF|nr:MULTISPECIES: M56 family metallopeptidase [unclassified Listeria]
MEKFLSQLFEISLAMSLIILAFIAFNYFFAKKYAAKWRYVIWIIILIGLLIPFRPTFDFSLTNNNPPLERIETAQEASVLESETSADNTVVVQSDAERNSVLDISMILFVIWLTGALLFLAYTLWSHIKFSRLVKRWSSPVRDAAILTVLEQEKERLNLLHKKVAVYTCKMEISPMFIHLLRPTILIPNKTISEDELAFIFRHELVHFKRKDLWVRYAMLMINAIYWFNPVIYFMAKALQNDCEESCDEKVVRGLDRSGRIEYGETIIGVIGRGKTLNTKLSTNFYGGKKTMKKRLTTIMDTSKKKVGVALLVSVLTISGIAVSGSIWLNGSDSHAEAAADITASQAKKIALKETGGGKVVKYNLDTENGRKVYEIEIVKGNTKYSIDIGAADSRIYSYEEKQINSGTTSTNKKEITAAEAEQIALKKAGGGKVTSSKVADENNKKVYEIEILNGNVKHDVEVGALDSKIYKYEKETVNTSGQASPKTGSENNTTNKSTSGTTGISLAQAQQIALAKTGGGRVVNAYTDYDDGRKEYDFKIVNGNTEYEVEIGAADSKVYKFEKETIRTSGSGSQAQTKSNGTPSQTAEISLSKAQQIALGRTGGGRVITSEVDYENGRKEYEFEIVKGNMEYDVTVGAADSKIYNFDQETVDGDDD